MTFDPYRTPHRARIEERYRRAYAQAGFALNTRSKVLPRPRPTAKPPALSKHPSPSRKPTMASPASPPTIPLRVEALANVPRRLLPLYQAVDGGYSLTPAGQVLATYRAALAKDQPQEPIYYKQPLSRTAWQLLVGLASPGAERAHLLRCAATRRIKIEG
jgi:hypothetical protein